ESAVINTSHLRKGIYILEVHTAGDVSIQKIVIE
ncbi:MAG TPA: T9SS type A sorting domain-containing protein, partial [Bacteroidales bacterium]|nr:T9SS type A sorting domain-containing protein [Bacteroidales bacterium]